MSSVRKTYGPSLLSRINNATSEHELRGLLEEGAGYKRASDDTKYKWAKAAKRRLEALRT